MRRVTPVLCVTAIGLLLAGCAGGPTFPGFSQPEAPPPAAPTPVELVVAAAVTPKSTLRAVGTAP